MSIQAIDRLKKTGYSTSMKITTFRPKKRRRKNKHGFRKRSLNRAGQKVLLRRRRKGRKRLAL